MRNVVLICLDTVRKDFFDEYASRLTARADVTFENCRAASSWSVPSHASMFTGELPSDHGVHDYQRSFRTLEAHDTFMGDLEEHYTTGVSANVWAGPAFAFDELFDGFWSVSPDRRFPDGIDIGEFGYECDKSGLSRIAAFARACLAHDHTLQSIGNGAIVGLDKLFATLPVPKIWDDGASIISREGVSAAANAPEPYFMFTNFMDAHAPHQHVLGYDKSLHNASNSWSSRDWNKWDVNLGGAEGLDSVRADVETHRDLYAASIDYLDQVVNEFVDDLQAESNKELTIVITADHGENLGYPEDGYLFGHDASLSEGLLHVPLLIMNPPEGYPDTVSGYVSHLQLGELLVGLANGETPDVTRDHIPAELIGSTNAGPPEDEEYWTRMLRAVYTSDAEFTKTVWDSLGGSNRYRLDPVNSCWQELIETDIDYAGLEEEFFKEDIESAVTNARQVDEEREISKATEDRLDDLGYV